MAMMHDHLPASVETGIQVFQAVKEKEKGGILVYPSGSNPVTVLVEARPVRTAMARCG
jgi:hypothetical protein